MLFRTVRIALLASLCGFGLLAGQTAHARAGDTADDGFVPLFDGQTLEGWRKVGGDATFRVEDGCIVGEVGPGPNTFLRTEKTYGDFILELDVKLDVLGNSGTQVRSHQQNGDGRVFGYQVEIDPSARAWTGGIYDESRRGWLFPLTDHPEAQQAFQKQDWNHFVIEARGPHLRSWLNGVLCADLLDTQDLDGFLALQVHVGQEGRIRWKNIRLKDLGRSAWQPLWDGQTLAGWNPLGQGHWQIEAGAIHGTHSAGEPQSGSLVTQQSQTDFAVRLKFQLNQGTSGLFFRSEPDGDLGLRGLEAEIASRTDVGRLIQWTGHPENLQPAPNDLAKWLKPNDWNELSVVALGDRVVVQLNGWTTAQTTGLKEPREGRIALQLPGGQDVDVRFQDLEILILEGPAQDQ